MNSVYGGIVRSRVRAGIRRSVGDPGNKDWKSLSIVDGMRFTRLPARQEHSVIPRKIFFLADRVFLPSLTICCVTIVI